MSKIETSLASVLLPSEGPIPTSENLYSVQKGDTLGEIAKQNGVSLETLLASNPQITNADRIEVGQQINLPSQSVSSTQTSTTENAKELQTSATPGAATEAKGFMDMGASLLQRSLQGTIDMGRNLYNNVAGEKVAIAPGTPPATSETKPAEPQTSGLDSARAQELAKVKTEGMTDDQKYDHYKELITAGGGKFNDAPNARNIVSVRNPSTLDVRDGKGEYNDQMAVVWKDAEGKTHVEEFVGNTDPNRFWSKTDSRDVDGDGVKEAGRLPAGFYEYKVDQRTLKKDGVEHVENALRPANDVDVERDMNHDGVFNDGGQLSSAGQSILFHNGKGNYDTGSAGCQTIKKDDWDRFWKAASEGSNQANIGYTLVQAG
jgi:hypothetical protein